MGVKIQLVRGPENRRVRWWELTVLVFLVSTYLGQLSSYCNTFEIITLMGTAGEIGGRDQTALRTKLQTRAVVSRLECHARICSEY